MCVHGLLASTEAGIVQASELRSVAFPESEALLRLPVACVSISERVIPNGGLYFLLGGQLPGVQFAREHSLIVAFTVRGDGSRLSSAVESSRRSHDFERAPPVSCGKATVHLLTRLVLRLKAKLFILESLFTLELLVEPLLLVVPHLCQVAFLTGLTQQEAC